MRAVSLLVAVVCLFPCGVSVRAAMADGPSAPAGTPASHAPAAGSDRARIDDGVAANATGRISVNQAAGTGNAQVNAAAIAQGVDGIAAMHVSQQARTPEQAAARQARADIGAAFQGVAGMVSVNQAAGSANLQGNLVVIAGGAELPVVPDAMLAATTAMTGNNDLPVSRTDPPMVSIADGAFRGAQGLVQVNQSAGVGNRSTNIFVLRLPGGTSP